MVLVSSVTGAGAWGLLRMGKSDRNWRSRGVVFFLFPSAMAQMGDAFAGWFGAFFQGGV